MPPKKHAPTHAFLERLEPRLLLSTINWVNRGTPASDSDNFNADFGSDANLARLIVDRAVDDWEAVIDDFNYADGSNDFDLNLFSFNIGAIADGIPTAIDGDGRPTAGTVRVDSTTTHYFDPTPQDDAEFTSFVSKFAAFGPVVGVDFYTTVIHEIGHAIGILTGVGSAIDAFTTDTGIQDPSTAAPGNLIAVNHDGGAIDFTFTNSDFGHLWEGPATATTTAAGLPTHPNDLMNPGRALPANQRFLISDTNAQLMQDVYGYTVTFPSQLNTFYANFNSTTGELTVRGNSGTGSDLITLDTIGPDTRVQVNGTSELIPTASITSIQINPMAGTDIVRINDAPGSAPINIDLGDGIDTAIIGDGNLDTITAPIHVNGGPDGDFVIVNDNDNAFSDTYTIGITGPDNLIDRTIFGGLTFESVLTATLNAQSGNNTFNIAPFNTTDLTINANAGNDTFNVNDFTSLLSLDGEDGNDTYNMHFLHSTATLDGGNDDDTLNITPTAQNIQNVQGAIAFTGNSGNDTVHADDQTNFHDDTYTITSTTIERPFFPTLTYDTTETITLNAGTGHNNIDIASTVIGSTLTVNAGPGDDNIAVGTGLGNIQGNVTVAGQGDTDTVTLNDASALGNSYNLSSTAVSWVVPFLGTRSLTYDNTVDSLVLNATTGTDLVDINNTPADTDIIINTLAANDTINIHDTTFGSTVTINAGEDDDIFHVTPTGMNIDPLSNSPSLNGDGGTDTVTIHDNLNADNDSFLISGSGVFRGGRGAFINTIENTTLNAGPGNNDISIIATPSPITINAGLGNDNFDLGVTITGVGTIITNISDPITANGEGGTDTATLDNSASSSAGTYRVTLNTVMFPISIPAPGTNTFNYTGLEGVTLLTGTNDDTVNMPNNNGGTPLTIHTGAGADNINLGTGNLDILSAPITLNAGPDHDAVTLDDSTLGFDDAYTITDTTVTRPFFGGLTYDSIQALTLKAQTGNNTITATSLQPDTLLTVEAGPGNDTVNTTAVNNNVRLDGGPGNDALTSASGNDTLLDGPGDDNLNGGANQDTYILTPGSTDIVTDPDGKDTLDFSLSSAPIDINLELIGALQTITPFGDDLVLNGTFENFIGSPFDDTIFARPLAVARSIDGGPPTGVLPGDTLIFDPLGLPAIDTGTTIETPGFAAVTYLSIETLSGIPRGPRVTQVLVASTDWTAPFFTALGDPAGHAIPTGTAQLDNLIWDNLNLVAARFTKDIAAPTIANLKIDGPGTPPIPIAVAYDPSTKTATWILDSPLTAGGYKLTLLDDIEDTLGHPLNGEFSDTDPLPSGDATNGGNFSMSLNVLPGDFNNDDAVDATDIDTLAAAIRTAAYNPTLDLTGDAALTFAADTTHLVESILGTRFGDINLDLRVDVADLAVFALNFGTAPTSWVTGDFNGDAATTVADLSLLALNFGFDGTLSPLTADPAAARTQPTHPQPDRYQYRRSNYYASYWLINRRQSNPPNYHAHPNNQTILHE